MPSPNHKKKAASSSSPKGSAKDSNNLVISSALPPRNSGSLERDTGLVRNSGLGPRSGAVPIKYSSVRKKFFNDIIGSSVFNEEVNNEHGSIRNAELDYIALDPTIPKAHPPAGEKKAQFKGRRKSGVTKQKRSGSKGGKRKTRRLIDGMSKPLTKPAIKNNTINTPQK